MDGVIHIISADAPADMLALARTLTGPGDTVISIGAAPSKELFNRKTISVRAPLGNAPLAGLQLRKLTRNAKILHAWSPAAASAAQWTPRHKSIIFSLPHLRGVHQADIAISGAFDGLWTLTVPTDAQRRVLIALGLHPKRIMVLPPSAEAPNDAMEKRARVREELGLDDRHFLLAAAGEMVHANGHKQACWAHAMARILTDQTRIVFPGTGPARSAVETFARSTGHQREIFFTGGRLDPIDVLSGSDAAIFLQRHDCGVGALADAMSCSLPIIASNRPEIADCTQDRRAALLSTPGDMRQAADHVLTLGGDEKLRKELGAESAKLAAEKFTPSAACEKSQEIYSSVLSGPS
jgi:glycosyltransferase involved in cell wall biosynthesis